MKALVSLLVVLLSAPAAAQVTPVDTGVKITRAWPVMGTMFVATVWANDTAAALSGIRAARDSVRLVDSLMSTYRAESELSRVNASAGHVEAVAISPQTLYVLLLARRYWTMSGGLFDPTVGPLVRAWGFQRDSGPRGVPRRAVLDSLRRLVGYGRVEIDSARHSVRLPEPGMQLDFGGVAKGYALDLARAALRDGSIRGGTVDLGGNVLAFGRPPRGAKWKLGVAHPRRDGRLLGVVAIDSGAVATSGDYERFITIDGVRYGHLIDPRTGYPRRGVIAATAIGPRGEWSDGLSAVLFLAGATRGAQLADSLADVAGIWVLDRPGGVSSRGVVLSMRGRQLFQSRLSRRVVKPD